MKKVIAMLLAAAVLPAVARDEVQVEWSYDTSEARMLNSDAKLFVRPFVTDLELVVPPKATEKTAKRIYWEITITGQEYLSLAAYDNKGNMVQNLTESNMKNHAVYLASVGKAAPVNNEMLTFDILVAPLFDMSFNQSGCTIRFTGYPARYTNWQPATPEQFSEWIRSSENGQTETRRGINSGVGVEEVEVKKERASGMSALIGK